MALLLLLLLLLVLLLHACGPRQSDRLIRIIEC
jgi:hypothetical protein